MVLGVCRCMGAAGGGGLQFCTGGSPLFTLPPCPSLTALKGITFSHSQIKKIGRVLSTTLICDTGPGGSGSPNWGGGWLSREGGFGDR